jgi:hypothetical protein
MARIMMDIGMGSYSWSRSVYLVSPDTDLYLTDQGRSYSCL